MTRIWNVMKGISSPVTLRHPFRALSLATPPSARSWILLRNITLASQPTPQPTNYRPAAFQLFLSGRFLFVRTTERNTDPHPASRGVPQGSVPSPLLFNVIMASLPALLPHHARLTLYADDMCLWTSAARRDTIQHRLQGGLYIIVAYLAYLGLSVSPSKTVAMVLTCRSFTRFPLVIEGSPLPFVPYCKYLGVVLHRGLSWSRHIKSLTTNINSYVAVLRCLAAFPSSVVSTEAEIEISSLAKPGASASAWESLRPPRHTLSKPRHADRRSMSCGTAQPSTFSHGILLGTLFSTFATSTKTVRPLTSVVLSFRQRVRPCTVLPALARPGDVDACKTWDLCHFPGLQRKNDVPVTVARQLALEHLSSAYQLSRAIYTDGSVANESSAAAYYVSQENRDLALRLPYTVSSTDAEPLGLLAALRHIAESMPDAWVVLTDSKASLALLSAYHPGVVNDLRTMVLQEYAHLSSVGHRSCLQWVPGHTGLHGNTCGDAAARRAALDAPTPSIDPSLEFVIGRRSTREEESLLYRFRMNVALTRSLLFKIGRVPSPT
ncbi:uncharacterized protein LOC135384869 [Ornithodoros turicata]|uniref:uncharacterized protein LOC135384869 n=1 Tax=Ornithodoros turicata TaxID=34597 RepID=UPI0031396D92